MEESGSPQHDARCGVAEEAVAEREAAVGCTARGVVDEQGQGEDGKRPSAAIVIATELSVALGSLLPTSVGALAPPDTLLIL
jgi:hypothetical protein